MYPTIRDGEAITVAPVSPDELSAATSCCAVMARACSRTASSA